MVTRDRFDLTFDEMIVRLTISLFLEDSKKALPSKFNGYNISRKELEEWCTGQTVYFASVGRISNDKERTTRGQKKKHKESANKTEAMTVPGRLCQLWRA